MKFELDALPYDQGELAPHISAETMSFHYGKHHQAYMNNLKGLIGDTPLADKTLEEVIKASDGGVFNNAAQVFNHSFYWESMSPNGGGNPQGDLAAAINTAFGSLENFADEFAKAAATQFGSGWAWLVKNTDGSLSVEQTANAGTPISGNATPLLTIDVWEHAYYLDYQNLRPKYIETFMEHLVNWRAAEKRFAAAG